MSDEAGCDLCVYSSGSEDGPDDDFCVTTVLTARKVHRCCECRGPIQKGERYERVVGKWYGAMSTFKTCLACVDIRHTFCCDGWTYTLLWEDFEEYFEHLTTGCVAKLETAAGKALLVERWHAWKFGSTDGPSTDGVAR